MTFVFFLYFLSGRKAETETEELRGQIEVVFLKRALMNAVQRVTVSTSESSHSHICSP